MQKLKDALIGIIGIGCFIGIIGLLMAYDDGLLENSLLSEIISVALPSFIGAYLITTITSFWQEKLTNNIRFLKPISVITFLTLSLCILFLSVDTLIIIAAIIIGLTFITLIAFCIGNIFHR